MRWSTRSQFWWFVVPLADIFYMILNNQTATSLLNMKKTCLLPLKFLLFDYESPVQDCYLVAYFSLSDTVAWFSVCSPKILIFSRTVNHCAPLFPVVVFVHVINLISLHGGEVSVTLSAIAVLCTTVKNDLSYCMHSLHSVHIWQNNCCIKSFLTDEYLFVILFHKPSCNKLSQVQVTSRQNN